MSVNLVTGIVTFTLAEWREEWEAWQSDGAIHERNRIIELLKSHQWFEQGERNQVLGMIDGSYECECDGCIVLIKGENK